MVVRPYLLIPVVLLVIYIAFLGIWFHTRPYRVPMEPVVVPMAIPMQQYSPEYRQASKCYDCEPCMLREFHRAGSGACEPPKACERSEYSGHCPMHALRHANLSHGQPKMTPGF